MRFIESLLSLRRYCRKVVPHICIGLLEGRLKGEADALLGLKRIWPDISEFTFIILRPTKGTQYENADPPSPDDVRKIFKLARKEFPSCKINLGCMRPKGIDYDVIALECGLDSIVNPGKKAKDHAAKNGLRTTEKDMCCSL